MRDQLVPFQAQITGTVWSQTDTISVRSPLRFPALFEPASVDCRDLDAVRPSILCRAGHSFATSEETGRTPKQAMENIVALGNDLLTVITGLPHGNAGSDGESNSAIPSGRCRTYRDRRAVRAEKRILCGFGDPPLRSLSSGGSIVPRRGPAVGHSAGATGGIGLPRPSSTSLSATCGDGGPRERR